ncbi:MAG: membrane dipeptidase, partial [Chloroflexi bacterium]|nr:membrane dipeptidase [Chloroflexota bacterium]
VRIIQITYNEGNYAGAGCLESTDWGLSRFGMDLIDEMNRLGLLIDLSHVGYRTSMEAIEASQQPVAFTHANPRALCENPRNKTDEQLLAVARKGGVIGANIFPPFLAKGSQATIEDFVDAIDYMVRLVGIDHVAIGTDFTEDQPEAWFRWLLMRRGNRKQIIPLDYPIINPEGIRSAAEFPNITRALLKRGYANADVKKIMGENLLRVFQTVWL